jgi:hypothetical protein
MRRLETSMLRAGNNTELTMQSSPLVQLKHVMQLLKAFAHRHHDSIDLI